ATAQLSNDTAFKVKIDQGPAFLQKLLKEDGDIYGVTTGYGDSCTTSIPHHLVNELPKHLYTFHGCGSGQKLTAELGRALLATRLTSLSLGYSGVRWALLKQIETLLQQDIIPLIPEEGSVGASGDLTPLSYVAAVLCGERQVYYQDHVHPTSELFKKLNISPLVLKPKEGLAIMNGTAVMTAMACIAFSRAEYLAQLATRITALACTAHLGNTYHFDRTLFEAKPHPGQQTIALWLRQDLRVDNPPRNSDRLQDRYSLRCAPHVIGVLQDALPWLRQSIENELNSANDNPIIDAHGEHVLHGGHFYGGHIAFAMDALKNLVANIADLLDRQLAQMVDPKFNNGLPANLSGSEGERRAINHGLKAVQIAVSAWTAEALKLTLPASIFSRSTECHNQDKVSMGTIAARDCLRVLQLTEQVCAAALLASCQALELRLRREEIQQSQLSTALTHTLDDVRKVTPFLNEDRALDAELETLVNHIQQRAWPLYTGAIA
ncbi:MAG TPA: histidine ammonia-lyase, partial [Gammaproteobacteria bacterium]|nr:histidine ammonia-lyase [Gammaproteobacteria bacterium]